MGWDHLRLLAMDTAPRFNISARHESGAGKRFTAQADNHAGVEKHLQSLHAHVKANNLGTHNVSIQDTHTGENHSAKVNPAAGVYKRTYTSLT